MLDHRLIADDERLSVGVGHELGRVEVPLLS
jgi:hypothetical protein